MKFGRNELLLSLAYFTRLPVAGLTTFSDAGLARAVAWFPAVGWIVAGTTGAVLWLSAWVLPLPLAVLLSMVAGILLTGGFHEDGLADTGDGFGPVADREQALAAMKDPRLGVFAVMALGLVLAGKFLALSSFATPLAAASALLVAHPLSRLAVITVIATQPYLQRANSRSRSAAQAMPASGWLLAAPAGLLPLAMVVEPVRIAVVLLVAGVVLVSVTGLCRRRFGGYTGDVLGAVQQLVELAILISLTATWPAATL